MWWTGMEMGETSKTKTNQQCTMYIECAADAKDANDIKSEKNNNTFKEWTDCCCCCCQVIIHIQWQWDGSWQWISLFCCCKNHHEFEWKVKSVLYALYMHVCNVSQTPNERKRAIQRNIRDEIFLQEKKPPHRHGEWWIKIIHSWSRCTTWRSTKYYNGTGRGRGRARVQRTCNNRVQHSNINCIYK